MPDKRGLSVSPPQPTSKKSKQSSQMTSAVAPPTPEPVRDEHANKFDRQIRLWGAHGQGSLETAHILMLGSGPMATETLKNLVLPNVGAFTIVDDAIVSAADLGNNFFVEADQVGKPRAEATTELLCEMNDSCRGHALTKSVREVAGGDLEFFSDFQCVVAAHTDMHGDLLQRVAEFLWQKHIPLLVLRASGLIASLRLAVPEHTVMESHPEDDRSDLYIHPRQLELFPQLREFLFSFDVNVEDGEQHAHIPFVSILAQLAKRWMDSHDGELPKGWDQQQEFKKTITGVSRGDSELNFEEAVKEAHKCYNLPRIAGDVSTVLDHASAANLSASSSNFWILVAALKKFREQNDGFLPVPFALTDMTTDTQSYVKLKKIYAARAEHDLNCVSQLVAGLLSDLGRDAQSICAAETRTFVKNCRNIQVVSGRSLKQEYDASQADAETIGEQFVSWDDDDSGEGEEDKPLQPKSVHWHFALRAAETFQTKNQGRFPGQGDKEAEVAQLVAAQEALFKDLAIDFQSLGVDKPVEKQCLEEIWRCGPAEIHNISAMVGGIASQAVLKLLTRQYVPFDNTVIVNGIHCIQETFRF